MAPNPKKAQTKSKTPPSWQYNLDLKETSSGQRLALVDCHTHSYFSGDSSTLVNKYIDQFEKSGLTHVAITDHQSIDAYPLLQEKLGAAVICGQEQRIKEGEIIGLFIHKRIPPGLSLTEAASRIRGQGGLVYLCHPLDPQRVSLDKEALMYGLDHQLFDAIEFCNSKSMSLNRVVQKLASQYEIPLLGGSDAHVPDAIGSSGTIMPWFVSPDSFKNSIKSAIPYGRYYDPPRVWQNRSVPETSQL